MPFSHIALRDPRQRAMTVSLLASVAMLVGKITAFELTGSAAIFSDAAESVVHIIATGFVAFGLWYAHRPADREHLYGHGKMAYVTSAVEGTLVLLAGGSILWAGIHALVSGAALEQLGAGLLLITALGFVNLGLGVYLKRAGRRHNSVVLRSNGEHVLTDMWTSFGVVAGVGLAWLTGALWLDAVLAIGVGIHVVWTALGMLNRAFEGIMEKAHPADTEALIGLLDAATSDGRICGYHQLRHRRVNNHVWVEMHLLLPSDLRLTDAHARGHAVEDAIVALFPDDDVRVTTHLEPEEHDDAHPEGHAEPADPLRGVLETLAG